MFSLFFSIISLVFSSNFSRSFLIFLFVVFHIFLPFFFVILVSLNFINFFTNINKYFRIFI
uniref:Uncharacterized protein n=1 Tax=Meloidogyne enterolobii TaxID=390850 RepID=A0A6V7V8P7_MELEN|nr:unnamed protein product [Meloidogyne enterolobii]